MTEGKNKTNVKPPCTIDKRTVLPPPAPQPECKPMTDVEKGYQIAINQIKKEIDYWRDGNSMKSIRIYLLDDKIKYLEAFKDKIIESNYE